MKKMEGGRGGREGGKGMERKSGVRCSATCFGDSAAPTAAAAAATTAAESDGYKSGLVTEEEGRK